MRLVAAIIVFVASPSLATAGVSVHRGGDQGGTVIDGRRQIDVARAGVQLAAFRAPYEMNHAVPTLGTGAAASPHTTAC